MKYNKIQINQLIREKKSKLWYRMNKKGSVNLDM